MKTRVYIDGFNLYHGAIKPNRSHWLNLEEFARRLNSGHTADRIIYCTALIASTSDDLEKAKRQVAYHQAIRTACPNVEIVLGSFTTHKKFRRLAGCSKSPACVVKIIERNEKGSDVNLATRLIHDAHLGRFDRAIVVSGDSDLVEPVRIVVSEVGREVWVVNPYARESKELKKVASDYRHIGATILHQSQLENPLRVAGKTYHKPLHWTQIPASKVKIETHNSTCPDGRCGDHLIAFRYQ